MTKKSVRIGFGGGDRRLPGIGGHIGLFHMAGADESGGRVVSVGYLRLDRSDLQALRDKGIRLRVVAVGVVRLGPDVSPALAAEVLDMRVLGKVVADKRTSAALRRQ